MKVINNPQESQKVTLDIVFKINHIPFNENHARAILDNYFKAKGITFNGEEIII